MKSKYIKTWDQYLADNPEIREKEAEAMKEKITQSEKAVFNFIISLLL